MISEKRLEKELQERFETYIEKCSPLETLKADGYAECTAMCLK